MKEIRTSDLQIGDVLASSIYCDFSYKLLLPKGTVIKEEHLEKLRKIKHQASCTILASNDTDGLSIDLLSRVKDSRVKKAYVDTFIVGKAIYESLSQGNPINIRLACEVVDVLVDQILQNESLLLQLTSVRLIDDYTFSHMVNCALYAASMGRCLGKNPEEIRDLCLAGLLHDVGKAKIPRDILRKCGELSREEFETIKKHPELGYYELCKYGELNERVRQAALQHHERGDGSGYPDRLNKESISLFSRIIAVVDVYDALTSDRCYRGRILPHESAEILMGDGSLDRLDRELVKAFLKHVALYPLGIDVQLSIGRKGQVRRVHPDFPLRPVVSLYPQNGSPEEEMDLMNSPTVFITRVLT